MSSKTNTAAAKEEATPALLPKLRFPEFQDTWELTPIGEKVDLLSGYPFDGPEIGQESSGVRLLRGINITEGRVRHTPEIDRFYTGETDGLEKFRVRVNDLVIGMDGSKVGKNSALISDDDADALLIQRVARLRTTSPTLIQFIFQQINSTTFHSYVDKINTSSGIPHISAKQIRDFTIGFPSSAEQQKIAECLSSVDELMAAQARKVHALKTHKKGLMQQLFPREGETQPRLRFPEFQNAGGWGVKALGTFSKVGDIDHKMPSSVMDGIPYVMTGDFFGINGIDFKNAKRVSDSDYEQLSKKIKPEFGDIVMARYASVGAVRYIETNIKFLVSYSCAIIKCDKSANSRYLYYVFQSDAIQSRVGSEINMSSQKNIGIDSIKKLSIFLAPISEQQKIADCLTSLEALITAETQKHEALKTHKKGLMQQVFPSPEAVAA